jgi:hypothetical protein
MPLSRLRLLGVAIVGATLTAGCASAPLVSSFSPLNRASGQRSAKAATDVELVTIAPSHPYVEGGVVSVSRGRGITGSGRPCTEIVSIMRQEAARQGCDGLMVAKSLVVCAANGGADEPANYAGGVLGSCLYYGNR